MNAVREKALESAQFPNTRYQGSKRKLVKWIWNCVKFLDFDIVGDLFGGTAAVSYMFKQNGKSVVFNDILKSNYYNGLALIENSHDKIEDEDIDIILSKNSNEGNKVQTIFKDIFFTDEENRFIDNYIANIKEYYEDSKYKKALLLWCLFQACIIKRPFNLFHRKNLYMRFNHVDRTFGNKITWDRPFNLYIKKFADEIYNAVFNRGRYYKALNLNVFDVGESFDLVYIDTPYIAKNGTSVDYRQFYHFLEGLCNYDNWEDSIDYEKKHRPLFIQNNPWNSKLKINQAFESLFDKFRNSNLVVSYRSDGIPSIIDINKIMKKFKKNVILSSFGDYKYVLSQNAGSQEVLIIGYD